MQTGHRSQAGKHEKQRKNRWTTIPRETLDRMSDMASPMPSSSRARRSRNKAQARSSTMSAGADTILAEAFHRTLREVCFAEKLSARVYKRVAARTHSSALQQAMRDQQIGSARRVLNLIRVFRMIGKRARSETCTSIYELTTEMESHIVSTGFYAGNDAILITWFQQLDEYWLSRYGLLKEWSNKLGLSGVEEALTETLQDIAEVMALLDQLADDNAEGGIGTFSYFNDMSQIDRRKVFVS